MKIIHITDTSIYNFDGISTYINELLGVSSKNNDTVLVLTNTPFGDNIRKFKNNEKVKLHAFKCFRFPGKPKFVISFPNKIKKIIQEFNPDIIWIHTIGTLGTRTAKIAQGKYKIVYTKHCFDAELWNSYMKIPKNLHWILNSIAQKIENKVLKAANKVVYHLNDNSKIKISPYFYKFNHIPPPLNNRFFQEKKGKKENSKLTLGFCGRAEPDKGIEITFKGLEILETKYNFIDFKFVFIGDGPEAHRMKAKYPDADIQITGYVNDVIPHLDKLDAMIISSFQETISLSSLEAYARNIPIFSVPIGYLYEHKDEIKNYFLFNTPNELAALIYMKLINVKKNAEKKIKHNSKIINLKDFIIDYDELYLRVQKVLST